MSDVASLDRSRYVNLATFRKSGAEVRTPVWFAAVDGKLYVFSAGDAGKVKRLRHTSRVRVAACDARGRLRDGWRDGTARIVTDQATIARARAALVAKYGWRLRLFDAFARLAGRVRRRAWIEIV
jgi:hypothetical protein